MHLGGKKEVYRRRVDVLKEDQGVVVPGWRIGFGIGNMLFTICRFYTLSRFFLPRSADALFFFSWVFIHFFRS